jgi:uncharacterized membrane protein YphA (DoxX/SURF4 family)
MSEIFLLKSQAMVEQIGPHCNIEAIHVYDSNFTDCCGFGSVKCVASSIWKKTGYRGGSSGNLKEEFSSYGLPPWTVYFIGFLKVSSALALIAGIWLPVVVFPAALLVSFLMLGALAMHFKIRDPLKKSAPAFVMLLLSIGVTVL